MIRLCQLVYQSKATKAVGLLLKPQTGSAIARFEGVDFEVTGSVVLPLTPVNKPTHSFGGSLIYHVRAELQENDEYESGPARCRRRGQRTRSHSPPRAARSLRQAHRRVP
jgi:hypothetical protein